MVLRPSRKRGVKSYDRRETTSCDSLGVPPGWPIRTSESHPPGQLARRSRKIHIEVSRQECIEKNMRYALESTVDGIDRRWVSRTCQAVSGIPARKETRVGASSSRRASDSGGPVVTRVLCHAGHPASGFPFPVAAGSWGAVRVCDADREDVGTRGGRSGRYVSTERTRFSRRTDVIT